MNSGLYAFAGDSATATAAACANRFDEPMTNVSNMYLGLRRFPSLAGRGRRAARLAPAPWTNVPNMYLGLRRFPCLAGGGRRSSRPVPAPDRCGGAIPVPPMLPVG